MKINDRISAFAALGALLRNYPSGKTQHEETWEIQLATAIQQSALHNPWFTSDSIQLALSNLGELLQNEVLSQWMAPYEPLVKSSLSNKSVGLVMAGNIPAVGFHDLLCVLMCGYKAKVKLSSQDRFLLPFMASFLEGHNAAFAGRISFSEERIGGFDAVIATGSNNASRYFESYFAKFPHIIRGNRNSVGVLSGNESQGSLSLLCDDIFQYFGLGCRNVSHLMVPAGYSFDPLLRAAERYHSLSTHHKYASNYMYYKTIFQMNAQVFWDNGVLLIKAHDAYSSPVSVLYYSEYNHLGEVNAALHRDRDQIQCVVSAIPAIERAQAFGSTQSPALYDYADGVDTVQFLSGLQ
jgi:hypothetical protein